PWSTQPQRCKHSRKSVHEHHRNPPHQGPRILDLETSALACHGGRLSLSSRAHRLAGLGDLLFKPAVALAAIDYGAGLYSLWHLVPLAGAHTTAVLCLCGPVCGG